MRAHGPTASASLNRSRRATDLASCVGGHRVDLVVVGGGITGAGVALDAASRGLRTVLIEAHDLAFGTSRWSSKLAHGGLRYLASGDVGIAYESAVERGHLLRTAPHLVHGAPMLTPLLPSISRRGAATIRAGFAAGDLLRRAARTPSAELPPPRRLSIEQTQALAPSLPSAGLRGGLVGYDGQLTDDARLVVTVARTAATYGARIITRCRANAITAQGVDITDALTGERGTIAARAVVNATGVWTPELAGPAGPRVQPSRGTHVVLTEAALLGLRANLTLPYPGEQNRYLLVLPQGDGRIYLGLTDDAVDEIEDVPTPSLSEVKGLVDALGTVLGRELDPAHVVGAFAGLRPLLSGDAGTATSDLSRRHAILRGEHHAVHVVGGKLTTYRRMAQDAVDAAIDHASLQPQGPCVTTRLPLVGAQSRAQLAALVSAARLPALHVHRFGTEALHLAELERKDPGLAAQIGPGLPVTQSELRFAVEHEGALLAEDLLDRRFRIGLVAADRAAAFAAAEAALR